MIIIEGPDGSGKSTLARELKKRIEGSDILEWNDPPKSAEELARNLRISKESARNCYPTIQDRTPWVTEPIYDVLKNGPDKILTWNHYLAGLVLLRSTLIYCRPPDVVIKAHAAEGLSPSDTPTYLTWINENAADMIFLYDKFMGSLKPLVYDWTDPDPEFIPTLLKRVEKKKLFASIKKNQLTRSIKGRSHVD